MYGESLGDLWRDYEAAARRNSPTTTADAAVARLTARAFRSADRGSIVPVPRLPAYVVYAAINPHGFPGLYRVAADGGVPRKSATIMNFGSTTAAGRDAIYFDQVEPRRNVALFSDLNSV